MPNQLSASKRRLSLAESSVVLDALAEIAQAEKTTASSLIRTALRDIVRDRATASSMAPRLQKLAHRMAPIVPVEFRSAAHVARFKRAQREHDKLLLDLKLTEPEEIQSKNSIVPSDQKVRVLNFASAHA